MLIELKRKVRLIEWLCLRINLAETFHQSISIQDAESHFHQMHPIATTHRTVVQLITSMRWNLAITYSHPV
jgi:hypothetical protein